MNVGDKVLIKTYWGGIYNGKTGVIIPDGEEKPPAGFVRVRFDEPIQTESREYKGDIFYPSELTVL